MSTVESEQLGSTVESEVAEAYLRAVRSEGDEEELLDGIATLERRIKGLRGAIASSADCIRRTRQEIETSKEEAAKLQAEDLTTQTVNELPSDEADRILDALIDAKTKLAQATEERERQKLERKRLEEHLAKAKFDFAEVITASPRR